MFEFSMNENEVREVRINYSAYCDMYLSTEEDTEWAKTDKEKNIVNIIRKYINIFFKYSNKKPVTFSFYGDDIYVSFDKIDEPKREYIVFKNIRKIIDDIFSKDVDKELW